MEARRYIPHYTYTDYEQWEGDWELWAGVPVAMTPAPSFRHQRIGAELIAQIATQLRNHDNCPCQVVYEADWKISDDMVVRPDIAIVCETDTRTPYIDRPPALIIEILSPSTRNKDLVEKRGLYAEQGVRYYITVDPDAETVGTLTHTANGYLPVSPDKDLTRIPLHEGCELTIDWSSMPWN